MRRDTPSFVYNADIFSISYMSVAVIKYYKQGNIHEKEFI